MRPSDAGMWRRLIFSCCLAAICVGVLGARVYLTFDRVRVRVITAPMVADSASMTVHLPGHARLSGQPTAIILRVLGAPEATDITVAMDGNQLTRVRVSARRDIRIDTSTATSWGADAEHTLTLTASRPGWSLTYLELATVHGYSGWPASLVVVPHDRTSERILPVWALFLLFAGLVALRPSLDWPAGRGRHVHRIGIGLVLLLFAATLLAPVFTQYGVLVSLQTLGICAAVLYAEPLLRFVWSFLKIIWLGGPRPPVTPPVPRWREVLMVGAGLTVVVGLVLHVQVVNPYSVPDLGDPLFSIWRISWIDQHILAAPHRLFDANIFYPAPRTLTYSDSIILPAITAMPLLRVGLHPVLVYNLLLMSGFVFSGVATYVLARCLGFGVVAAWTSGVIFAIYPYRLDHYSHLELQMAQWMPLALLGIHRLMLAGGGRHVALTALAVGAQWYSSMYYALFLSLYVAVFALVLALAWREWRRLGLAACSVVVGAALAWPLAHVYQQLQQEQGVRPLDAVLHFSATPADYLQPTPRSALYAGMRVRPGIGERELFPGIAPVALAGVGVLPPVSPPRLALLVAGLVAFDGSLGMNGRTYPLLYEHLFPFRSIRVPARFAMLVGLTLALLSGAAVERWRPRGWNRLPSLVVAALLTLLVVADAWPALRLVPVWRHPPAIYGGLGPSSGAVLLEYPIHSDPDYFAENLPFMYFSTWHWTPMVNGYSGNVSRAYIQLAHAMRGFPNGDTLPYLRKIGVTHISVICAIDGPSGALGVPRPSQTKCDETISHLDVDPRLRSVVRARWEDAPALLYEFR